MAYHEASTNAETSFRAEWQRRIRRESLHFTQECVKKRRPANERQAYADVFTAGMWLSTYANFDGSDAFPSQETLAMLTGMSKERLRQCLKVLALTGALRTKRRPNSNSGYMLQPLIGPVGSIPVERHIRLVLETRSKKRHTKDKAQRIDGPGADGVHARSPDEEGGHRARTTSGQHARLASEMPGQRARTPPDSVHARDPDSVRAGGVQRPDTCPPTDTNLRPSFTAQVDSGPRDVGQEDSIPDDPDEVRSQLALIDAWFTEHQCHDGGGCTEEGAVYRRRLKLAQALRGMTLGRSA